MPSPDVDALKEGDRRLRHQHSASSDHGRALVPMWDSSDPDRAPPPLPLNPQSPSMASSRAGTSAAIQSAHAALTEKARESALVSNALAKRVGDSSPERPSPSSRGTQHRRMQSLQPGSVRDLSLMLEGSSPTKSPERLRPATPVRSRDADRDSKPSEKDMRGGTPAPTPAPTITPSLTPVVRPSVRRPPQSILGENTPPQSATMMALQNMPPPSSRDASRDAVESPLSNVTNGSSALIRAPQSIESLSGQILSLTSIATSLQKEMAALSRRSRDNATDLMSLKQATNARDEDIRKSLRELVANAHDVPIHPTPRDQFSGGLFLDNKPHHGSLPSLSKSARPFSLPRIPSPNSFAASIERETMSTPSLCGSDAPATIALLEKILREMGTKEGQELLIGRLSEVQERLRGMATSAKVEELLDLLRGEQAVVPLAGGGGGRSGNGGQRPRTFSFDDGSSSRELEYGGGPMTRRVERLLANKDNQRSSGSSSSAAADLVNDDILKIIRTVKDSVAQGGGLTAEVKALVRELRGEVLGMGREIGRRLDEMVAKSSQEKTEPTKEEIEHIIDEGLGQMKEHMNQLLREHRRQSAASATSRASQVDYQEIYNAMRAALKDSQTGKPQLPELRKEDVIEAVRDAWENYKPEIQVEQIGLDRDEVLACLQEGLRDYAPRDTRPTGATRDEVFHAVVEGLKHFVPPQVETPAMLSRDEILDAVRECLEEFEFPVAPSAINAELTRDDMLHAVREGLAGFESARSAALVPHQGGNDDLAARLQEIMTFMRAEFKAVSDEAKQNVAANGRDTEQVLDATKDGFDKLRADIEGLVGRVSGVTGQDELMETVVHSLDTFRDEVSDLITRSTDGSRGALQEQMESIREAVNSSIVPIAPQVNQKEILEALRDGLDSVRLEIHRPTAGTAQILDALQEGFADLRGSLDKAAHRPADLTANDEILDALKAGMDSVRSDIDTLREESRNDRTVATLSDGAVVPADVVKTDDIKNLEVLITQLRIKLEAMQTVPETVSKDDISRMEDTLRHVQESVEGIQDRRQEATVNPEGAASREDVQAIETILRNTKARLDDLIDGEQAVQKEHIDALETLILETRESLSQVTTQLDGVSKREDITMLESLVSQVAAGFDELKERADKEIENPERVTKTDVEAVEAACLDIKATLDQMAKTDLAALPSRDDMKKVEDLVSGLRDRLDTQAETNSKALEDRQAEIVGVSDRVTEVKSFLEDFRSLMKSRLEDGATGIDALGKLLDNLTDVMAQNANVGQDLKSMHDTMKVEFEESRAGVVGAKLDADEKFQQTTDALATKIDERIDELIVKYDELQAAMEAKTKAGEAHDAETEAAVLSTKAIAEELKSLIDTLGSAVTDSLEKMEEASKTVFNRVEDLLTRADETQSDNKAEHQQTRDQVTRTLAAVEGLQGHVCEYEPKILETVKDVLQVVGQHYDFAKTSTTTIQQKIEEAAKEEPPMLPPPEKYDDSEVHQKLDKLVDHTNTAGKAFAQLDTLEKVHQQVQKTAADISDFLAAQTQRISDEEEDREKTLQDVTITLERRKVEKEHLETSVASLRDEEERLRAVLASLKQDQEALTRQKTRLTADVSSLETALHLRREELQEMEVRAEGLERRILDGVMDHSRVLLMSKATKGRDAMSRKRVQTQKTPTSAPISETGARQSVNLALSAKQGLAPPRVSAAARRIVSLGQITGNTQSSGFKRSQSVRMPGGAGRTMRKSSWGGSLAKGYGELDKENVALRESEEESEDATRGSGNRRSMVVVNSTESLVDSSGDDQSDTETLRRTSRGTITTDATDRDRYTEGDYSGDDGDSLYSGSEYTESAVGVSTVNEGAGDGHEVVLFGSN